MSRRLSPLLVALAVALVVAGGLYLYMRPAATAEAGTAGAAAAEGSAKTATVARPAISVTPVTVHVLKDRVRASGLVGAVDEVRIQPQIEGQAIESVNADVGDKVSQGDVLATLSDSALTLQKSQLEASRAAAMATIAQSEAQMVEAKASADTADKARARAELLKQQGSLSQAAYDQAVTAATAADAGVLVATQTNAAAKAQLDVVDAQIQNVNLQLSRTKITAPADGTIIEKNASTGAIASASGKAMFVLIRDGLLQMNADVAEQDLPRLAVGQRVALRAAGSTTPLTGTVRLVEPAIDPVTRLGRIRIVVDQPAPVRSGTFLEAEVQISDREVPSVPINALGTDADGSYVMAVDDQGKVHRTPVQTGVRDGGLVEITSGLAPGQNVVAKAASFVRDGDQVTPVALADAGQPVTN